MARHRLLYLYLSERTRLFADRLSLLHFSPEPGLSAVFKARRNLRYATSWDQPDRPADFHLDLTKLAQPDESWDVMIAYHVFEHIPRTIVPECGKCSRVLKPGGFAVLQVPVRDEPDSLEDPTADEQTRVTKFLQFDHVRYYGWKDFADRLTEAGFDVQIERYGLDLSPDLIREYGLDHTERIYIARKPRK